MLNAVTPATLLEEEALVTELDLLGVSYLSRLATTHPAPVRPPDRLLADLVRQSSARVREAVIAVLLVHPELAASVMAALVGLTPADQVTLRLFYTAAVLLQQEYAGPLQELLPLRSQPLPDLFASELGLSHHGTPGERLIRLGQRHRLLSGTAVNWTGTYHNVAHHLFRRLELERRRRRSPRVPGVFR